MSETEPSSTVADNSKPSFFMHRQDLIQANADRTYFIQRRDTFSEKLSVGILILNAGSLLTLLTLLGSSADTVRLLGFTPGISIFSAAAFIIGLLLARHSLNERALHYIQEASDANSRALILRRLVSMGEASLSFENYEGYGDVLEESHSAPLVGFQWSASHTAAHHAAQGAWAAGIIAPTLMSLYINFGPAIRSWSNIWH